MLNNRNDRLSQVVGSVTLAESTTSYFSEPEKELDPSLFDGVKIKSWVRNSLLRMLHNFLAKSYRNSESWATTWIAGSAVSYQWHMKREPGDLDILVGVNYEIFRKTNLEYAGLTDTEISKMLNEDFRSGLMPDTKDWEGFEVTFYVNPGATDIRVIKPYAAYDLTHNEWTVTPDPQARGKNEPVWEQAAMRDHQKTVEIVARYTAAVSALEGAQNPAARRNAEYQVLTALEQASALWDDIHGSRKRAFSQTGEGYGDFYNYRWQAGKRLGTVVALRRLKEYLDSFKETTASETYGVTLPDTQTLIRRAATYRTGR
jgi:hypothetical protein